MNPLYIFKTGSTYPDIAQANGDFEAMIAATLIPCPLPLRTINIPAGEPLPAPEACAGVIITGSHSMVSERAPWSEATAAWLQQAAAQSTPVFGICYGTNYWHTPSAEQSITTRKAAKTKPCCSPA